MGNKHSKAIPSIEQIRSMRNIIVGWHKTNNRYYPWRETDDPFKVLIAEMMLRRTKADQVKPVYERLFSEYPDIKAFVKARDKKLEKLFYPLGLKWRTPAFMLVVEEVVESYQCEVPRTREELTTLPGVGDYVAGAVLSIAYNKKEWIVDSNVVRLFKRYFGIFTSKEGRRDKHVIEIAKLYADYKNPRIGNLAILDFTALVCKPRNPLCEECSLNKKCNEWNSRATASKHASKSLAGVSNKSEAN